MEDWIFEEMHFPVFACVFYERSYCSIRKDDSPSLTYAITNAGNSKSPPCWVSVREHGGFFIDHRRVQMEALGANETTVVTIPLEYKGDGIDKDLPEFFTLTFASMEGLELFTWTTKLSIGQFMGDFEQAIPKREIIVRDSNGALRKVRAPVNILVIGPAGQGKTAFIQNIFTLLQREATNSDVIRNLTVGNFRGGKGHATLEFTRHGLADTGDPKYDFLGIWDTPGIAENTYQGNEMEMILNGCLPSEGVVMDDDLESDRMRNTLREERYSRGFRVPQVVILVMTIGLMDDPEMCGKMKRQVRELRDFGYQPLVVISKADEGEEEATSKRIRENPQDFFELAPHKKQEFENFINELGGAHNNVYHMVSYVSETKRTFGIDKLTYVVLHEALKRAGEFINMEEKKQNRVHKCGDYSSGGIISRYQRMRNSRDDFSDLIGEGELVEEFQSSASISSQRNPQNDANAPFKDRSTNNTASRSSCNTQCYYCYEFVPLANKAFVNFKEPCGHRILCEVCLDHFKVGDKCPKCKNKIDQILEIIDNRI